ncbi:hypothetical protein [uncultured Methylobacterium sp.]|uniref:hypothetical protein n=1 Tax=uncultured Methylobacterium sp. TaxID=157278 RepID=UPI0035CCA6E1
MKIVALNHAETCRRSGLALGYETTTLDVLGYGLRDAYASMSPPMPDRLLILARQLDERCVKSDRSA